MEFQMTEQCISCLRPRTQERSIIPYSPVPFATRATDITDVSQRIQRAWPGWLTCKPTERITTRYWPFLAVFSPLQSKRIPKQAFSLFVLPLPWTSQIGAHSISTLDLTSEGGLVGLSRRPVEGDPPRSADRCDNACIHYNASGLPYT